ncbi:MAG TPA: hypothetical protein VGL70_12545 [Candidatus Binatia bacterium]
MTRKVRPTALDSVCGYCLFFQPQSPGNGNIRSGNCCYHKEWIENAYRTTCSEMSRDRLEEKGIYELVANDKAGWQYIRRTEKLRTRLFSVK